MCFGTSLKETEKKEGARKSQRPYRNKSETRALPEFFLNEFGMTTVREKNIYEQVESTV